MRLIFALAALLPILAAAPAGATTISGAYTGTFLFGNDSSNLFGGGSLTGEVRCVDRSARLAPCRPE